MSGTEGPLGTVRLLVETALSSRPLYEDVPARATKGGRWILDATPGLALGAAAGDVVEVDKEGAFRVTARGGNIAIHVSAAAGASQERDSLTEAIGSLGGRLDARAWTRDGSSSLSVYTVPAAAGFGPIEQVLVEFASAAPGGEWYYGNVYDPADGTPLNWWD
ncbi:MAG TPA: DUF4265 domain-containing protein [Kribbella sp.]|nr:DUF4265 domain-containing protein [Kribbella sp.]